MLSIIPVPIGNKDDITLRSLGLLKELSVFFCEDTRNLQKLFRLYDIDWRNKKLYSLNSFTSQQSMQYYLDILQTTHCGLVSDAGTPGLSDPGKGLIKYCWEWSIKFEVLPGATALIPAVVASYTDTSSFVYLGFPPTKKGRQTFFKNLLEFTQPVYIYESVHRIEKTLLQIRALGFSGRVFVAREVSKMFEQFAHGTIDEILEKIKNNEIPLKGEFVLGFISNDHHEN